MVFVDEPHEAFADRPAGDDRVWRYMDLPRYLSLLQSRSLYFARLDQMPDRWEGAYGPLNAALRPNVYKENWSTMEPAFRGLTSVSRSIHFANCWHVSAVESAAMWNLYQERGAGVALTSTWGRLTESITSDKSVYGAKVTYVDYNTTYTPEGNLFHAVMRKRLSYEHEREARLVVAQTHPEDEPERQPVGLPIAVNLGELVVATYVTPGAPSWFLDVVKGVTERYGFAFNVIQSDLDSDPIA